MMLEGTAEPCHQITDIVTNEMWSVSDTTTAKLSVTISLYWLPP